MGVATKVEQGYYWATKKGESCRIVVLISAWQKVFIFNPKVCRNGRWIEAGNIEDFDIKEAYEWEEV